MKTLMSKKTFRLFCTFCLIMVITATTVFAASGELYTASSLKSSSFDLVAGTATLDWETGIDHPNDTAEYVVELWQDKLLDTRVYSSGTCSVSSGSWDYGSDDISVSSGKYYVKVIKTDSTYTYTQVLVDWYCDN